MSGTSVLHEGAVAEADGHVSTGCAHATSVAVCGIFLCHATQHPTEIMHVGPPVLVTPSRDPYMPSLHSTLYILHLCSLYILMF